MKNFVKNNKIKIVFFSIIFGIVVLLLLMIYPLYGTRSGSNYGNRLDGIKEVKLSDSAINNIKNNIKDNLKVDKVDIDIKGKIINIIVKLGDEVVDTATEYIPSVYKLLDEKQLSYYDIQVYLVKDDINIIGYKSKTSEVIIWTNNR